MNKPHYRLHVSFTGPALRYAWWSIEREGGKRTGWYRSPPYDRIKKGSEQMSKAKIVKRPEVEKMIETEMTCICGKNFFPKRYQINNHLYKGSSIVCSRACAQHTSEQKGIEKGGLNAKMEQNSRACFYCIESPQKKRYTFRNLRHFIRTNENLFTEFELVTKHNCTRAEAGIRQLFLKNGSSMSYHDWKAVWRKDSLGNINWEKAE